MAFQHGSTLHEEVEYAPGATISGQYHFFQRGGFMATIGCALLVIGSILLFDRAQAHAADDACALVTQAQVSGALEVPVNEGTPIGRPSSCQWTGKGRTATLTVMQPLAGKNAIERFNAGKASTMPGITVEPVTGVGDEAYYVYFTGTTRAGLGLVVKKGTSAFEIRVYGFEIDKAKPVAKTLCQIVAGKI